MRRITSLFLVLALTAACASIPLKQRLVQENQINESILGHAQDAVRAGCVSDPVAFTPARCQAIAAIFSKAFAAQIVTSKALIAWKAGDPKPTSVADYTADAAAILMEVRTIVPPNSTVQQILTAVQAVLDEANTLNALFSK